MSGYTDDSLIKVGTASCLDMRRGVPPLTVVKEAVKDGLSDHSARTIVFYAETVFCSDILKNDGSNLVETGS